MERKRKREGKRGKREEGEHTNKQILIEYSR